MENISIEDRNLKSMEEFLNIDLKIKQILIESAPSELDKYDENSRMNYYDKLYKQFKDIEFYFKKITECFDFEIYRDLINEKMNTIREDAFFSNDIRTSYQKYFSNLGEKLVEDVKENLRGYYLNRDIERLIKESTTVNELLHVMHSYVTNNEQILQSLPIIDERSLSEIEKVTMYGNENEIAREIFKCYKLAPTFRQADIISLENKILMMVRDRGHALSIEIDTSQEKAMVKYFIPKICNANKVNQLRGVNKVNDDAKDTDSTIGLFEVNKNILANEIIDFIDKVPTDDDIKIVCQKIEENQIENKIETTEKEEKALAVISEQKRGILTWIKEKMIKFKEKFSKKDPTMQQNIKNDKKRENFIKNMTNDGQLRDLKTNKQSVIAKKLENEKQIQVQEAEEEKDYDK